MAEPGVEPDLQQQVPVVAPLQQQEAVNDRNMGSVKLPDFWPGDAELWFSRVESVFRRNNVLDSLTRFDYIMEKIPNDVLTTIKDLVRGVDENTDNPYGLVKDRLLHTLKPSAWSLINKIIDFPELGGSRPSVMMANMLSLLPEGEQPGMLFQGHFLRRLPESMREQLAVRTFESSREMADYADVLWEARNMSAASLSAIGNRSSSPGRQKSPGHQKSPTRAKKRGGLCFFHFKFKEGAYRCVPPCTWPENGQAASNSFSN